MLRGTKTKTTPTPQSKKRTQEALQGASKPSSDTKCQFYVTKAVHQMRISPGRFLQPHLSVRLTARARTHPPGLQQRQVPFNSAWMNSQLQTPEQYNAIKLSVYRTRRASRVKSNGQLHKGKTSSRFQSRIEHDRGIPRLLPDQIRALAYMHMSAHQPGHTLINQQ